MSLSNIRIAFYGQTLQTDVTLKNRLEENFEVYYCKNINHINHTIENKSIDLLLLEIGSNGKELKILKELHTKWPKLSVISLGLEEPKEDLIKAFIYGSNDFYKIPLNIELLIERIEGIVKRNNERRSTSTMMHG